MSIMITKKIVMVLVVDATDDVDNDVDDGDAAAGNGDVNDDDEEDGNEADSYVKMRTSIFAHESVFPACACGCYGSYCHTLNLYLIYRFRIQ